MPNKPVIPDGAVFWDIEAGHRYIREGGEWVRRTDPAIQAGYQAVWDLIEATPETPKSTALVWRAIYTYQAAVDKAQQENPGV